MTASSKTVLIIYVIACEWWLWLV